MNDIGILNYGTGNLASIVKAVDALGSRAKIVQTSEDLSNVSRIVLPGVGHFGTAMRYLNMSKLGEAIKSASLAGIPVLGICLGFQLLCESSEEDPTVPGLGLLPFKVQRLVPPANTPIKTPHIGWNSISGSHGRPKLLEDLPAMTRIFYYSNAFGIRAQGLKSVSATYLHGNSYLALVEDRTVFGVQFHPEKSRQQGLSVLASFLRSEKC